MKYPLLFSEGSIGSVVLKNRTVMPAIGTSLATSSGEASQELIRYYEERAKGGCGLIITEIILLRSRLSGLSFCENKSLSLFYLSVFIISPY